MPDCFDPFSERSYVTRAETPAPILAHQLIELAPIPAFLVLITYVTIDAALAPIIA